MNPDLARQIRWVIFDVDGVMTDGSLFISSAGIESKRFFVPDGTGISLLHAAGYRTAFISGRASEAVQKRAGELGVTVVLEGIRDKSTALSELQDRKGFTDMETAYVGDDLIDISVMRRVALPAAPSDGHPLVRKTALFVSERPGGRGAVRDFCEAFLQTVDRYDSAVWKRYGV